jgi:hypothetical protein
MLNQQSTQCFSQRSQMPLQISVFKDNMPRAVSAFERTRLH